MCGLATLYKEWGHEVSGSDTEEEFFTDRILKELNIPIVSLDPSEICSGIDEVIFSTAYTEHSQVARARELGIHVLSYTEALARLSKAKKTIVVTGSHGKTTATAMLGRVLEEAGLDPTVIVGGELIEWGKTARAGKSDLLVAEGDEYQAKMLEFGASAAIITNIDYDHPDFYKTPEDYESAFKQFVTEIPDSGIIVAHESTRMILESTKKTITYYDEVRGLRLEVWGKHNLKNASGVLALAKILGVAEGSALKTLSQFRGTKRRTELYTKEDAEIVVIDDYAHHPTEIRATLATLREQYPERKIIAVFQPHTYSRTKALVADFAQCFGDATSVVLVEIYSSAREHDRSITIDELAGAVRKHHSNVQVAHSLGEAVDLAHLLVIPESVVVTLGAGDVWQVARELQKRDYK